MRKTILTILLVATSLALMAQKKDSLVIQITIDSTQLKQVFQLIQENIPSNTLTGKMVIQNIVQPLQKGIKWVRNPEAVEPKKTLPIKK